jgi:shikimate dehydrogenase
MAAGQSGITEFVDEHQMPTTKAACVIGWPVGHSRSPLIHNYWIKQHGLDAEYRREAVAPEQFKDFITHLAARGYVGANVTVPHKEASLALSEPDDRARAVGAANTLWLDGARLRSTNTDVEGFVGNLDATAPDWDRGLQCALVLGAGGAARAVVSGLLDRGTGRVFLVNRTAARAAALRTQFGDRVEPARWGDLDALMPEAGLLVNTTSLGMAGQPPLTINLGRLPANAVVSDLVYAPLETALLADARSRRLRAVDGLGMLLHQAVGGFQRWFGVRPQVTEALRALVEADLISK